MFSSKILQKFTLLLITIFLTLLVNRISANECPEQIHFFKNYQTLNFGSKIRQNWPSWQNTFTEGYLYIAVWAKYFNIAPKNKNLKHSIFTIQSESDQKSNVYEWALNPSDNRIYLLYNGENISEKPITSSISGRNLEESKWF